MFIKLTEEKNEEKNDYNYKVGPYVNLLRNKGFISQAYKKVNSFLRDNSWYVDHLQLDCINLNLQENLNIFVNETKKKHIIDIIPAPKHSIWTFPEGKEKESFDAWKPEKELELRPIADVPIYLQVKAMAIVMCLADFFESQQKEIKEDISDILKGGFYSYGNRLDVLWHDVNGEQRALYHTGSSSIYEKYFKNYKLFLKRPNQVAHHYHSSLGVNKKIYIISLDIEKFYDNVDLAILYKKISNSLINNPQYNLYDVNVFCEKCEEILNWKYNQQYTELVDIKKGLPQGLAASGFLSNIYLLEFDNLFSGLINKNIMDVLRKHEIKLSEKKYDFKIRDYCRYVDDLRLVIETDKRFEEKHLKEAINELVNEYLKYDIETLYKNEPKVKKDKLIKKSLNVNTEKTNTTDFSKFSRPISRMLNSQRALASGTPSIQDVEMNLDSLKNMFMLSSFEKQKVNSGLAISNIVETRFDLKTTTVKKFLTTEFKKHIKSKEMLVVKEGLVKNEHDRLERYQFEQDKDFISKMLIDAWTKDPALVYLLKAAFEINPSLYLLKQVLEILNLKISSSVDCENSKESYVAYYIMSQLFFQGVTFVKRTSHEDSEKMQMYLEYLLVYAERLILQSQVTKLPYYVKQAILMFVTCMNKNILLIDPTLETKLLEQDSDKVKPYLLFLKVAFMYEHIEMDKQIDVLTMGLLSYQVLWDRNRFISWFTNFFKKVKSEKRNELLEIVYLEVPETFYELIKKHKYLQVDKEYDAFLNEYVYRKKELTMLNNEHISLLRIIYSNANPFNQENALLLLIKKLVKYYKKELKNDTSIVQISVSCKNWDEIQNPFYYNDDKFLEVHIAKEEPLIEFEKIPFWFKTNSHVFSEKHKVFYNVGKIVRCCLTSSINYTNYRNPIGYTVKGYRGFKSTSYLRQIGISNLYQELIRREHPITSWLKDFLSYCLRWPYSYYTIELEAKYKNIVHVIDEQIEFQKSLYCQLSKLPLYIYECNVPYLAERDNLKVAIVQTLLPKTNDFDSKNPLYWSPENRVNHRKHLKNLLNLIEKQFAAQTMDQSKENVIDLIVFPELSINSEDVDLLKKLSNSLKANIFAGLTFVEHSLKENAIINRAIWLIRQQGHLQEEIVEVYQGKLNMTKPEMKMGITGFRPYQIGVRFKMKNNVNWTVSGAICYDSTDLKLAADLRDTTDAFIVAAMNQDVQTFDNMASALSYHMYQPIILANTGEYGGSTVQAPYSGHNKLITHLHGNNQVGISIFDIDTNEFKNIEKKIVKPKVKTPPAGYSGRN